MPDIDTHVKSFWSAMIAASEKIELAMAYRNDGEQKSAARCLREAADLLDLAADEKSAAFLAIASIGKTHP